jgi:hypothetical protein
VEKIQNLTQRHQNILYHQPNSQAGGQKVGTNATLLSPK